MNRKSFDLKPFVPIVQSEHWLQFAAISDTIELFILKQTLLTAVFIVILCFFSFSSTFADVSHTEAL